MNTRLAAEFRYYLDHKTELVEKYQGKYVVIKGGEVLGVYADELEAIHETAKAHKLGTFIVQECLPGDENEVHYFTSRVAFA